MTLEASQQQVRRHMGPRQGRAAMRALWPALRHVGPGDVRPVCGLDPSSFVSKSLHKRDTGETALALKLDLLAYASRGARLHVRGCAPRDSQSLSGCNGKSNVTLAAKCKVDPMLDAHQGRGRRRRQLETGLEAKSHRKQRHAPSPAPSLTAFEAPCRCGVNCYCFCCIACGHEC